MSHRTAVIEEFDDDTDLPLPTLSDTGKGHVLEEIDEAGSSASVLPRQSSYQLQSSALKSLDQVPSNTVTDITPYKTYVKLLIAYFTMRIDLQMDVHLPYLY
jgi:signal recognition particle subunit SRP19